MGEGATTKVDIGKEGCVNGTVIGGEYASKLSKIFQTSFKHGSRRSEGGMTAAERILFADKLQPLVRCRRRRRLTSSLFYFIAHSERGGRSIKKAICQPGD